MLLPSDIIIRIVAAGGGFTIDLEKNILPFDVMIRIAAAAGQSGALITFRVGESLLPSDYMIRIAAAGKGNVIFDIS